MGIWNHLLPFVTVMKEGSFTRAARKLRVTPGALSQSVAQLEKKLGVLLFHRTTRQLHATNEAQTLFDSVGSLVSELDDRLGVLDYGGAEPSGLIRIAISSAFGRKRIVPLLASFLERYPKVSIEITFDSQSESLAQVGVDLAIRHGARHAGYIARALCRMQLVLVASPAYIARRGLPLSVEDLDKHEQISARMPDGGTIKWKWRTEVGEGLEQPGCKLHNIGSAAPKVVVAGHSDAVREIALAGMGIAAILADYVDDDLASGSLVRILPDLELQFPQPDDATIFLQYPERAYQPARVRALIDHLTERFG